MNNLFLNKLKEEDGAVLITSLLFLMVVTVLAIVGIQSPKVDIMISGNEKISVQAQQLANLGVMEGKNWLSLHYKPNAIPLNAGNGDKFFVVVRPTTAFIDKNFSRAGILSTATPAINFTSEDGTDVVTSLFNTPTGYTLPAGVNPLGKATSSSDYTLKDSSSNVIGTYEWSVIRISQVGSILDPEVKEAAETDIKLAMSGKGSINSNFTNPRPITEGYNAAIGEDKAFWQYFYINSEGKSDGLIAEAEGIASYKQIVPSSD